MHVPLMKALIFLPSYKLHLFITTTVGLRGTVHGPAALGSAETLVSWGGGVEHICLLTCPLRPPAASAATSWPRRAALCYSLSVS